MFCCCRARQPVVREIKLMCVGIDGAGKTAILKILKGEDPRNTLSTNGFSKIELFYNPSFHLTIYDLGGDERIRDIWDNYYAEVHGIVFVMDMNNTARYQEVYDCVKKCVSNRHNVGKPLLFVLNNVVNGEVDDVEFTNRANLHELCSEHRQYPFVTHTHKLDAFSHQKPNLNLVQRAKKYPTPLNSQFMLFVDKIIEHYVELSESVRQAEVALQIRQQAAKDARKLRLMQLEHAHRQNDIAALDGYAKSNTLQPEPVAFTSQEPATISIPVAATQMSQEQAKIAQTSPVCSASDTPASLISSDVFEPEQQNHAVERSVARNKVAPGSTDDTGRGSLLRDPSIFTIKQSKSSEGSVTLENSTRVRYASRMDRIKKGMEHRKRMENGLNDTNSIH